MAEKKHQQHEQQQNQEKKPKSKERKKRTSQSYKGVRMRKWGKWVSEIRVTKMKSNSRIWLGSYDTPEKAARAYDAALYCVRGTGHFNFPLLISTHLQPLSEDQRSALSNEDIKVIAKNYALNQFTVQTNDNHNENIGVEAMPPVEPNEAMMLPSTNNALPANLYQSCASPESFLIENIVTLWNTM
ncbi:hypothetical protein J5N97_026684 [Dioscorea zingiberensis]|uniref:AP2/ERF domain-containing protein n=1 Tax=Dioscorea zingiberensis TaxID=325984 RepID=A0A9D5C2Q1_9LILI|nr:hypothetical protein J5N97_026684 [Dioscorea zingiberensis]